MNLVSVIVPVYNVEKYLRICLESLLRQTYLNIEVIMVDDGSKDLSGKICDEYAAKYGNFKAFHKENAGLGMARNMGLEHISGEYVTFLDSDDYLDDNAIEVLLAEALSYGVDMCKGGFRKVKDNGQVQFNRQYEDVVFAGKEARNVLLPRMIGSSQEKSDSVEMCVCGALYKAEPILKHEIRFPSERVLISEDMVFNIDYMQYANGACLISNVGYNYRINLRSLTNSYRPDRFEACKYFYKEVKKKLQDLGYGEDVILRLERIFFVYLRMCLNQENGKVGKKKKAENIKRIREICSDPTVREIIAHYPKKKLGLKQNVFLKLIERRMANVLYGFFRWGGY